MILEIATAAAKECYPSNPEQAQDMIEDIKMLAQAFRMVLPIAGLALLGLSFSFFSLAVQGFLLWYVYQQTLLYYKMIRSHNHTCEDPMDLPQEILTIRKTTLKSINFHI